MGRVFTTLQRLVDGCLEALSSRFACWTKPLRNSLPLSTLADLGRSKSELIAENVLLRKPLIVLRRQVKRPTFTRTDRILLVLLVRLVRTWQQALLLVQPDTLLRGPRELFRLYWKRKSKTASHTPKVAAETVALIREMATQNRLWGAERMRGALLKLGLRVCKRTIRRRASTTQKRTRAEQCKHNAQAKSEQKRRTAFEALGLLQQEGKPVTKAAVAKRAGVSVVFLRSHPDLAQAIEEAEQIRLHTPTASSPGQAKDQVIAALRRRLDEMKHMLEKKESELRQKQREIDTLYGKLAAASQLPHQQGRNQER